MNTIQNRISNWRNLLILPKPEGNGNIQGMQDTKFYMEQNYSIVNDILEYNPSTKTFDNISYKSFPLMGDNIDKRNIYHY